jgi:hypothetical protein
MDGREHERNDDGTTFTGIVLFGAVLIGSTVPCPIREDTISAHMLGDSDGAGEVWALLVRRGRPGIVVTRTR